MSTKAIAPANPANKTNAAAPSATPAIATPTAANTSVDALAARLAKSAPAQPTNDPAPQTAVPPVAPTEPNPENQEVATETEQAAETTETTEQATEETAAAEEFTEETAAGETEEAAATETPSADSLAELRALVKEAGGDPALINAKIVKRFDRLTALRYDAESRAAQAEAQAKELSGRLEQNQANGIPALQPLHPEVEQLDQQIASAARVLQWADNALDEARDSGATEVEVADGKGGTQKFTLAQVRQYRSNAQMQFTGTTAKRETRVQKLNEEHAAKVSAAQAKAREAFPWTKQKNSPEMLEAHAILREVPELQLSTEWPLWLGWIIAGRKAAKTPAAAPVARPGAPLNGKPAGSRIPPAVVTTPAAIAPRVDPGQRTAEKADQQFRKSGTVEALADKFAAKREARLRQPAAV